MAIIPGNYWEDVPMRSGQLIFIQLMGILARASGSLISPMLSNIVHNKISDGFAMFRKTGKMRW